MKKFLIIILALVLVLAAATVLAEETTEEEKLATLTGPQFGDAVYDTIAKPATTATPSITGDDFIRVEVKIEDTDFAIFNVKEENRAEWFVPEFDAIVNYVAEGNAVLNYFPADITAKAAAYVGMPKDDVVCYEIIAPGCWHYMTKYGDIYAIGEFPTYYPLDLKVTVVVGFWEGTRDDGTNLMKWYVQETCTIEDGKLMIKFEQEVLERMDREHGIMVVASDVIPAE